MPPVTAFAYPLRQQSEEYSGGAAGGQVIVRFLTSAGTQESAYYLYSSHSRTLIDFVRRNVTGIKTVTFGKQTDASKTFVSRTGGAAGAGWYTQSVPEPTLGFLMLLGVAGLALCRRCSQSDSFRQRKETALLRCVHRNIAI